MKRRSFLRGLLAGAALTVAAPLLARGRVVNGFQRFDGRPDFIDQELCRHFAFESGPGIDGVRCLDCGKRIGAGTVWNNFLFVVPQNPPGSVEYYPLPSPKLRGSVIRFRRDPSKVFEL
jgi:hypothetical protein